MNKITADFEWFLCGKMRKNANYSSQKRIYNLEIAVMTVHQSSEKYWN